VGGFMKKYSRDLGLIFSSCALGLFVVAGVYRLLAHHAGSVDAGLVAALVAIIAFTVPLAGFYFRTKDKEKAESALREQNRRLNAVLANMPLGVSMVDAEGRLTLCNEQFAALYEMPRGLAKPGTLMAEIAGHMAARGVSETEEPRKPPATGEANRRDRHTAVHELCDGRVVAITERPVQGGGWVATHNDITELRRIESQIAHMARHDALTGLPNRLLLRERVEAAFARSQKGESFAVLCLGLDRFKDVNDSLGYKAADELLKAVSARLQDCLDENDLLARLGGDEFAILQMGKSQPIDASSLAERAGEELKRTFELDGHPIALEASIGIAIGPIDADDPDLLLKNAELALRKAKAEGRGRHAFFEPGMDSRMRDRRRLETELRFAIQNGEFELFYQPLLDAGTEKILGVEALVRWRHRTRGLVPPAEFIPLSEETGLIVPLGEWVIRQACADASCWPEHISVSVNLAAAQFETGSLVPVVIGAVSAAGIAADRLVLEITETALLKDTAATIETLHMLRNLGIRIAMDDFGTGYSSLSYLRSFPFDKIKIDRSFVKDLPSGEDARAIIRAVATLGESLGMTLTAEGVETAEQLSSVRSEGYTEIQGNFYSPPVPAAAIHEMFPRQRLAAGAR
jgi:diguanylate cyclase (GGDEF)-like protein